MQNNYFVFIKLRVGEYVEYIWDVLRYVLGATYLGALVFNRLSMPLLRKIVYAYIGIRGVVATFNWELGIRDQGWLRMDIFPCF